MDKVREPINFENMATSEDDEKECFANVFNVVTGTNDMANNKKVESAQKGIPLLTIYLIMFETCLVWECVGFSKRG